VVATTVASAEEAEDMARVLVAGRAAACVQCERIVSYYEWDGVLQTTPEWRLVCKTLPGVLNRLTALLREHHSYEVPQITMRTERCLPDYAQWLQAQVML
jgi:periplasmic divalent cation tolerance protein